MPTRNLLNSNIWQLVAPDANDEPLIIYNKYIPIPNNTQVGGIRPDNITTIIDNAGVLSAIGNGSIGNGQFVPYITFTSSQTPSFNQVFSSNLFIYYQGNASFATVSVNGALLQPNIDFGISLNSIQLYVYLEPFSLIEIQAKTLPMTVAQDVFLATESNDFLITESGDFLIIQQVFT